MIALLAVFLLVTAAGCREKEAPEPPKTEVVEEPPEEIAQTGADIIILKNSFEPETLTIKAGSAVVWKNMDDEVHFLSITKTDSPRENVLTWVVPRITPGGIADLDFAQPGIYEVRDAVFKFNGKIIVK